MKVFCRKSKTDSDLYLYITADGELDCCGCPLTGGGCHKVATYSAALAHLQEHENKGHRVPLFATLGLIEEQNKRGDVVQKPSLLHDGKTVAPSVTLTPAQMQLYYSTVGNSGNSGS